MPSHVINNLMVHTATMSKIVVTLICLGQISLMNKMTKTQYTEVELIMISNMTYDFPSQYMTQSTTLTNYCLYTCCHKTDIPRSQCINFKESKYNFGNAVVQETLSNQFSIPTSKEYICKKKV